ncbi:PepSY-like domain-containing protein [Ferruginibacter sp. SUN002]|uniref:PepSY-like domain-containing protein n=1 Tax=Ferruginibacter sp. SUN002 TaxID=2937789 RepID=UPI003D3654CA
MKKKLIGFAAIIMTIMTSCNSADSKTAEADTVVVKEKTKEVTTVYKTVEVAPIVQTKFIERYPAASDVQWVRYQDVPVTDADWNLMDWASLDTTDYAAKYVIDKKDYWSWYTPQGEWISTVSTIESTEVPAAVNKTLQSQFPGYTITFVNKENYKNKTAYKVKLEKGDDKMKVVMDENGSIMKQKGEEDGQKIKIKDKSL